MGNKSNQFTTTLDCEFLGELEATVHFDYLPEEKEVWYPNEDAHPGCPHEADVTNVIVKINEQSHSIMAMMPVHLVEELEERAIEWFSEQEEYCE